MVSFIRLLWRASGHSQRLIGFALLPLVLSLTAVEKIKRISQFYDTHFGFRFGFPGAITDLWAFVSMPNPSRSGVFVSIEGDAVVVALAVAGLTGIAMAAYLGCMERQLRTGSFDVVAAVRAYWAPLLAYNLLVAGLIVVAGLLALGSPGLAMLLIGGLLIAAYFFYATPFLVVAEDRGLIDALGRSWKLAISSGDYFAFFLQYILAVALVSIPVTWFVVNAGVPGVLVGAVATAPVALLFDVATMLFVLELVGESEQIDRERPAP